MEVPTTHCLPQCKQPGTPQLPWKLHDDSHHTMLPFEILLQH